MVDLIGANGKPGEARSAALVLMRVRCKANSGQPTGQSRHGCANSPGALALRPEMSKRRTVWLPCAYLVLSPLDPNPAKGASPTAG